MAITTRMRVGEMRASVALPVLALTIFATSASAQNAPLPAALPVGTIAVPANQLEDAASGEDIVVTGSRLGRKGVATPTPVTVVGEQRIQALAATNIGDVLRTLPAFRDVTSPTTNLASGGAGGNLGARYLDLRGLGASRTLVLVDGRRFVPNSFLNAVDVNLIPSSLVRQVEIVTGGASAAYGSDAVSGVVNILLDNKYDGIRGQIQRGIAQVGDAASTQASLVAGSSFGGGRGHVVVAGEWSKDENADDCYSRDWCRGEYSLYQNPGFKTNGMPANFIASNVHGRTFTHAGLINGPGALQGRQFNPNGTLSATPFQYGQGNDILFQIGGQSFGDNFRLAVPWLKIPVERYSLYGNVDYELADRLNAFVQVNYGGTKSQNRGAALFERALTIRSDNVFLPAEARDLLAANGLGSFVFGREGEFELGGNDISPTNAHAESKTLRVATGLNGVLGGTWRWDAYYQYGKSDYRLDTYNVRRMPNFTLALDAVAGPNGPICRSTITDPGNGCVPLNLFGIGRFSPEAYKYAFGTPWQEQHLRQHVLAANVRGDLFDLWAGPVSLAAGLEYRRDTTRAETDTVSLTPGQWQYGGGTQFTGKVVTKEGYLETVVPLARDMSFAKMLDLNGAVRLTDYSTSGRVTTWKAGVVYEPIDGVRFRATKSRDIRAPNAQELFSNGSSIPGSVVDRLTSVSSIATIRTGGNRDLVPERANTWTAGVVLTPGGSGVLAPLRFSVDWYDISIGKAITALGAQQIVDRCFQGVAELCDLITRGPDNVITMVRAPQLNLNRIVTRGLDAELDYRVDIGEDNSVGFRLLGSYLKDLTTIDTLGPIDRAGQTGQQLLGALGLPKWTLNGAATIRTGQLTTTIEMRYIPEGKYDATLIGPEDAGYANTLANSISSNRVDDRFYTNLGFQFEVGGQSRTKFEFYGAINNLFDKDPPIAPGNTATNPSLFDTLGRYFTVGARVKY